MSEIYNCWQCKRYSHMDSLCKKFHVSVAAADPICEGFEPIPAYETKKGVVLDGNSLYSKVQKKQESASDRIALIAKEIEWLRLDPGCHDQMVYDSLSTIETMMKHLSTSIKGTERDFMMEVVASE